MLQVRIGSLLFRDRGDWGFLIQDDEDGLTGWGDLPDARADDTERDAAHGDFDGAMSRSARYVTLLGRALADTPTELQAFHEQATGFGTGNLPLVVGDDRGWKRATARVRSVKWRETDEITADFQVSMKCADPRKYGETRPIVNGLAENRGNETAYPRIRIVGPKSGGYTLVSGGARYVVTETLPSGQTDEIDMLTRRRYRNGALAAGGVARRDTISVPKLSAVQITLEGGGTVGGTVTDTSL